MEGVLNTTNYCVFTVFVRWTLWCIHADSFLIFTHTVRTSCFLPANIRIRWCFPIIIRTRWLLPAATNKLISSCHHSYTVILHAAIRTKWLQPLLFAHDSFLLPFVHADFFMLLFVQDDTGRYCSHMIPSRYHSYKLIPSWHHSRELTLFSYYSSTVHQVCRARHRCSPFPVHTPSSKRLNSVKIEENHSFFVHIFLISKKKIRGIKLYAFKWDKEIHV